MGYASASGIFRLIHQHVQFPPALMPWLLREKSRLAGTGFALYLTLAQSGVSFVHGYAG